jgi:hypothetical protein
MHGQRPQLPSRRGDEPQRPCHETLATGPHTRGGASASPCQDQDRQTTECRRYHRRPAERAQPAADPRIAERCRNQRRHTPPQPRPRRADHRQAHARQCAPAGHVRAVQRGPSNTSPQHRTQTSKQSSNPRSSLQLRCISAGTHWAAASGLRLTQQGLLDAEQDANSGQAIDSCTMTPVEPSNGGSSWNRCATLAPKTDPPRAGLQPGALLVRENAASTATPSPRRMSRTPGCRLRVPGCYVTEDAPCAIDRRVHDVLAAGLDRRTIIDSVLRRILLVEHLQGRPAGGQCLPHPCRSDRARRAH